MNRALLQQALKDSLTKADEVLTAYISENPDVFKRGPTAYLTPNDPVAERRALKGLDEDAFWSKLDEIAQATSIEDAAKLLAGGRNG